MNIKSLEGGLASDIVQFWTLADLLTAGQALGQAGHWEGLHRKAKDGHLWDLTAPAMKACVLCGRLDEALELYKPEGSLACRDLAIQAWDPADPEIWELEYEDPSDEAKLALLVACSYQHSWRDAVDRFANYQYDRQFLLATMRACHTQKQFAAAYTCLARCLMNLDDQGGLPTNEFSLNHLLPFCLEQSEETDEFFATIMVTLSGLSLPLHELIEEEELIQSDWEQSKAVWAAYRMSPQNDPRGRPWMLNLHRLLQQQVIDEKFLLILTATVKSGNSMSQPDCGLWLAEAVNDPPDYLASALMEAHCLAGRPELAMELYYPCPRLVASAVRALLQMDRHEEAREMYQRESRPTHELVSVVAKDSFDRNEWRQVVDAYQWGLKSKCLTEDLGFWAIQAIASGHFPGRIRTMRSVVEELAQLSGLEPLVWASNNYWTLKNVVGFPNACALMFWKYDQDWRELDLAVNTFHQKRKSDQVTKTKVLQTIVQKACLYEGQENKRYARVPQTMEEWHHLLELVQEEAQHAHLMNRPFFVAQLAEAWNNLGRPQAALEVVEHSIGRMSLHVKAIEVGINAADKIGTPAADLRMLGLDDRK